MHLTALVGSPEHVCCRYRLAAYRPWLERAGHTLELVSLPRGWFGRWRLFRGLRHANVVLQRRLLPDWQLAVLRGAARLLLYDVDDAVFLRDSYSPKGLHDPGRLHRFAAVVRASDAVIAGNSFLGDQARRWVGGSSVHVIPSCVNPDLYSPLEDRPPRNETQLLWVGSASTLQGLERIRPLLEEMGARVPGLRLKLICDRFLQLSRMPVEVVSWTEAGEAAEIAAADVGISWVPDDLWSRGKCGLKVLQYMAAGLPVIVNPVGVHVEMVRHGENGFLAETPAQWVEAVRRLADDPELRRRLGWAGRRLVEQEYSVARGAAKWLGLLDGLDRRLARAG
jgi:glycosyltransferase involved in cell wall biosynthesis